MTASYANESKFELIVYDSNGEEVARSEIFNFTVESIDFWSVELG